MATYIVSCNNQCGSGSACGTPVCPEGYYCDAGQAEDSESGETACISGLCVGIADSAVSDKPCSRCKPGYMIVTWKEEYTTSEGSEDCEFTETECPQYCDTAECAAEGEDSSCSASAGCDTESREVYCGPSNIVICDGQKGICSKVGMPGEKDKDIGKRTYKGLVEGQEVKLCCSCESVECCAQPECITCEEAACPNCTPTYSSSCGSFIAVCP